MDKEKSSSLELPTGARKSSKIRGRGNKRGKSNRLRNKIVTEQDFISKHQQKRQSKLENPSNPYNSYVGQSVSRPCFFNDRDSKTLTGINAVNNLWCHMLPTSLAHDYHTKFNTYFRKTTNAGSAKKTLPTHAYKSCVDWWICLNFDGLRIGKVPLWAPIAITKQLDEAGMKYDFGLQTVDHLINDPRNGFYIVVGSLNIHRCHEDLPTFCQQLPAPPLIDVAVRDGIVDRVKQIDEVFLVIPSTGQFFSTMYPCSTDRIRSLASTLSSVGCNYLRYLSSFKPLPTSGLVMHGSDGLSLEGGMFSETKMVVHVHIQHKSNPITNTHYINAVHKEDKYCSFCPDIYKYIINNDIFSRSLKMSALELYHAILQQEGNNICLGKRTAQHTFVGYPEVCLPRAKIIDMTQYPHTTEFVIRVKFMNGGDGMLSTQNFIRVQRLSPEDMSPIQDICVQLGQLLDKLPESLCVRQDDLKKPKSFAWENKQVPEQICGKMFTVGEHPNLYKEGGPQMCEYQSSKHSNEIYSLQRDVAKGLSEILRRCMPVETTAMTRTLLSYDEEPPECLGGHDGLTKTMTVSVNFANAAHHDANDLGTGITVWLEADPNFPKSQYFVFPNVFIEENGVQYEGLLLRIFNGFVCAWNGCDARHFSSVRVDENTNKLMSSYNASSSTFGFHFGNSAHDLRACRRARLAEYNKVMCTNLDDKNATELAGKRNPDGSPVVDWLAFANEIKKKKYDDNKKY